jgi:uncharacterized protein YhaN
MRIAHLSIVRYGPVLSIPPTSLHDFTFFFGKNEEGKTLTIDALIKFLIPNPDKHFTGMDRVQEMPSGYVVIEDDAGHEIKLPDHAADSPLSDITPREYRNIFIIRNSDLAIAPEHDFFATLTDRLIGLHTEELRKIKAALRDIGKITPTGEMRDVKDDKWKTRIQTARELVEEITSLQATITTHGYDRLEEERVALLEELEAVQTQLDALEVARKREHYERGQMALDLLTDTLREIEPFQIFTRAEEERWRDAEKERSRMVRQGEKLTSELAATRQSCDHIDDELKKQLKVFVALEQQKHTMDDRILPELKNLEAKTSAAVLRNHVGTFVALVTLLAGVTLAVSLYGSARTSFPLLYITAALSAGIALAGGSVIFVSILARARLGRQLLRLRHVLAEMDLDGEDVASMLRTVHQVNHAYRDQRNVLQLVQRQRDNLEEVVRSLRERLQQAERAQRENEDSIDLLARRSGVESLTKYRWHVNKQDELAQVCREQRAILRSHFGETGHTLEEDIAFWTAALRKLEAFADQQKTLRYTEETFANCSKRKQQIIKRSSETQEEMERVKEQFQSVERRVNDVLRSDTEYLYCTTSLDLAAIRQVLKNFIDESEHRRQTALEAIGLFDEIEQEERSKITQLFGKENSVSHYFSVITDGRYDEVRYDEQTKSIRIVHADGTIMNTDRLSSGTFDQLYFAVRLALGERLLPDGRGFFILDDPFVKSDSDRLRNQLNILRQMTHEGWQILLFSAKNELLQFLSEDVERGTIQLIPLAQGHL